MSDTPLPLSYYTIHIILYPRACSACQQTTVPPDGQICPQITESRGKMIRHSITTPAQVCHKLIMSFPEKSLRNVPANDADFCHGRIAIGRRTLRMYYLLDRMKYHIIMSLALSSQSIYLPLMYQLDSKTVPKIIMK